jgi:hypothetical protein
MTKAEQTRLLTWRFKLLQRAASKPGSCGCRSGRSSPFASATSRTVNCRTPTPARPFRGWLTPVLWSSILDTVTLYPRLVAFALAVLLSAGNGAICAGWASTPEARMACCSDEGGACPMHKGDPHGSGSAHVLTQAQADDCCASSERDNSSQSSPTFVAAISSAVLGTGIVLPVAVPALVLTDGWRTAAPTPIGHVPKHVLLTVFLV